MPWLFRLPTVLEGPAGFDRLFGRVRIDRGISISEDPQGTYTALRFPTQDQTKDPFFFYLGGHEYVVDDATKAALIAWNNYGSGVTVTEANFTSVTGTFGIGGFGSGGFGG